MSQVIITPLLYGPVLSKYSYLLSCLSDTSFLLLSTTSLGLVTCSPVCLIALITYHYLCLYKSKVVLSQNQKLSIMQLTHY